MSKHNRSDHGRKHSLLVESRSTSGARANEAANEAARYKYIEQGQMKQQMKQQGIYIESKGK
jgi:hypothetical protein